MNEMKKLFQIMRITHFAQLLLKKIKIFINSFLKLTILNNELFQVLYIK